jgi:hypothetical protein
MDNRRNEVLAVATLFFVLTWLTVGMRCYVRGIMMKTWGQDDYYMCASLVSPGTCEGRPRLLKSTARFHRIPLIPDRRGSAWYWKTPSCSDG